jgi:hypothetical protein
MARHGWGRACALVGVATLVSIATGVGAGATTSLFGAPSHRAGPHIDPLGAPRARLRNTAGFASSIPHLNYYGGKVVSNVHVVQVLWGTGNYDPAVTGSGPGTLSGMYSQITNSP